MMGFSGISYVYMRFYIKGLEWIGERRALGLEGFCVSGIILD